MTPRAPSPQRRGGVSSRPLFRRFSIVVSLVVWATVVPVLDLPEAAGVVHKALALRAGGVIRAPVEFGLIGMTWPAREREPAEVRVRTSLDGKRWSRWEELDADEVDLGPDAGTEGIGLRATTPLWVGKARFADIRLEGGLPKGARVHVIDPGPDPSGPRASVLASPTQPGIITRAQWGANESIRRCCPRFASSLKSVVIHHTATGNSYTASQSAGIVRSIYAYHVQGNGWDDIGYNFLVDRHGQIFEGRAGGITKAVIGAHAQGFNTGTSGMAVIGTFSSARPPAAAWNALRHLVSWRLDVNYLDPLASVTMTSGGSSKWPAGQKVTLPRISAHKDLGTTTCPGQPFYDALGALRIEVAGHGDPKLVTPTRSRRIITPNGDGVADTVEVSALFSSPDVSWWVDVIDPFGKVWRTFTGSGSRLFASWDGKANGAPVAHDRYEFRLTGGNSRGSIRTVKLLTSVWRYPNGTLFRTTSGWAGVLEGQTLRHILTGRALSTHYAWSEAISISKDLLSAYPIGRDLGFRYGSVLRAGGKLWVISQDKRRPISRSTLDALGYSRDSIIDTSSRYLSPHPIGSPLTGSTGHPVGTSLRSTDLREGIVASGGVRPFLTSNIRKSHGIRDIDLAGPADAAMAGAPANRPMGFRNGTLVKAESSAAVYVISDGRRRHIRSGYLFDAMGYKRENIRKVTDAELALHPQGPPI